MTGGPIISDHALVRWLDRTGAMDVESLRAMLRASLARAADAAERIGGGRALILADGLVFVMSDGVIITVVEEDGRHARIHRATAALEAARASDG